MLYKLLIWLSTEVIHAKEQKNSLDMHRITEWFGLQGTLKFYFNSLLATELQIHIVSYRIA